MSSRKRDNQYILRLNWEGEKNYTGVFIKCNFLKEEDKEYSSSIFFTTRERDRERLSILFPLHKPENVFRDGLRS
jgi:hypothetical protein